MVVAVSFVLFGGVTYASAATSPPISCLEEDRGYKLINADGTIDPVRFYGLALKKITDSSLNGRTIGELHTFGVVTGDPREWARLITMMCKQESGCRIARTYSNGSLEKFSGTLPGERSYGPLQFNIGEYGLTSWAMVNSPSCTVEAVIRVVERNGSLSAYFGPIRRPNEILQHASWFNKTVQPFADALVLRFDPNAPDMRTYQALAPYFTDPSNSGLLGRGTSPFSLESPQQTMSVRSGQSAYPYLGASSSIVPTLPSSSYNVNQSTGIGDQSGGAGIPGPAAATIITQPKKVSRGKPILVSWSSVFMNATSICRVSIAGEEFATGNQGSKQYTSASPGEKTATLSCTRASGGMLTASDTFIVE